MLEIVLGAATLLGGAAAAWYFYDRWSGKTPRPITEGDLADLETRLKSLLKNQPPSLFPEPSVQVESDLGRDPLSKQILQLIESRQKLVSRLAALAEARGHPIPASEIPPRLKEVALPKTFEEAARRVLDFTSDLQRVHEIDLQHSQWAVDMTDACVGYIDIAISNIRNPEAPKSGA